MSTDHFSKDGATEAQKIHQTFILMITTYYKGNASAACAGPRQLSANFAETMLFKLEIIVALQTLFNNIKIF
jgi:hypothetical protein